MFAIDDLADRLEGYLQEEEIRQVKRAYYYAEQAHDGQRRRSGEPYVSHPLAVANILANLHMDPQSLMAAMLHDVIEDTAVTREALEEQFGREVANLVDGVSKLAKIAFEDKAVAQADNLQKMVLAMSRDIRVIIVKLADRLHNMRTLGSLRPDKKRRIARETLDIYARIANRLGINTIHIELEDLAFQAIHPMRSERIRSAVASARGNRRSLIRQIQNTLQETLDNAGLPGTVVGRQKHLLSIYRKMRDKHKSFNDLMDVFGFRIITDHVDDCYRILGAVHGLYKPVPGRFKDYIAIPKSNGYQSLHTTLFGVDGYPIEVQIRTRAMEATANNGIAAHWLYKAESDEAAEGGTSHERAHEWVQGLLEIQRQAGSSLEFFEHVKNDLFPDDTYVFTPKGEIMELPRDATAVDFAYAVHTDIGNSCIACRINRHLASLSMPLSSGQTVEIITAPGATPNQNWLNFVVTAKARSAIRHFLKHQQLSHSILLGRKLLNKALADFNTHLDNLPPGIMEAVLHDANLETVDDLFHAIGSGSNITYSIARKLAQPESGGDLALLPKPNLLSIEFGPKTEGIRAARCCYPLPGDQVIGHLTSNEGIWVHRRVCPNAVQLLTSPNQCVEIEWAEMPMHELFPSELEITIGRHPHLIANISELTDDAGADIESIRRCEHDERLVVIRLILLVQDRIHLARIIKRLRNLQSLEHVTRVIQQ